MNDLPDEEHEAGYPGNPFFEKVLLEETTQRVADRLREGSDSSHAPRSDLTREERSNLTSWVKLVLVSERESYGRAMQRAGYEVVDE